MLNTIGGMVTNFRDEDGHVIDPKWSLELTRGTGGDSVSFDSGAFMGATKGSGDAGAWDVQFHGDPGTDNAKPSAVSGTFDGHFTNGHVLGAFGANMVEDKK